MPEWSQISTQDSCGHALLGLLLDCGTCDSIADMNAGFSRTDVLITRIVRSERAGNVVFRLSIVARTAHVSAGATG